MIDSIESILIDKKILGLNASLTLSIRDYWKVAENILNKNDLQRRKVKAKGNAYTLLKRDLLEGCIMPPIILAVTEEYGDGISDLVSDVIQQGYVDKESREKLVTFIGQAFQQKQLIILDGLQRSYTIKSALEEAELIGKDIGSNEIRIEVYIGLSKMGILYRMLTLNTGQTPMSFRHQLEMLYHDYLDRNNLPDGISVLREIDESRARGIGKYKFSDVIDLFYSYSTGTYQAMDKETLVSQLKELNFLESYRPGAEDMLYLLQVYTKMVTKISSLSNDWEFPSGVEKPDQIVRPFGKNVASIFGKSQAMTGFGSACSRLIKAKKFNSLEHLGETFEQFSFGEMEPEFGLGQLIKILNEVNQMASRIGEHQRAYFDLAFRELLNPDSDNYCDLSNCWIEAKEKFDLMFSF